MYSDKFCEPQNDMSIEEQAGHLVSWFPQLCEKELRELIPVGFELSAESGYDSLDFSNSKPQIITLNSSAHPTFYYYDFTDIAMGAHWESDRPSRVDTIKRRVLSIHSDINKEHKYVSVKQSDPIYRERRWYRDLKEKEGVKGSSPPPVTASPPRELSEVGDVYFITDGEFVKIGKSGKVSQRIKDLQTSNPKELSLLATTIGGEKEEHRLHKVFESHRVRGEWFKLSDEIEEYINQL